MALADELGYLSAAELALRIRRRDLSPVEVMDACITRIEARNPSLNALVHLAFEEARAGARAAEQAVMSGADLGPLHGVPTALKDLFSFQPGWPSTFGGVPAFRDFRPDTQGLYAERMEQAGAILVGATNSPVMGFRGTCDNFLFGPTRNPFDLTRNSGGSSGGSAAAVADGLLPLAEATDGGGSIRIPASWCGVYGYKASFGRVPFVARPNAFMGDAPFIFDGAITRTVEDAALALTALAGYHPGDPYSLDGEVDYLAATRRGVEGWTIAYSPNLDVFPVDPRITEVVGQAVRAFEEAGAHVEDVTVGIQRAQRELSDLWCRLISPLSVKVFEGFKAAGVDLLGERRADLPGELIAWVEQSQTMMITELFADQEIRTEIYDAIQGVLGRRDLLITPTLACLPVLNTDDGNTKGPATIEGEAVDQLIGWCLTYPINFTGHPAASIPAGLVDGLPVGMQIVGRRLADADVLAASATFERLRPWQDSYRIPAARTL